MYTAALTCSLLATCISMFGLTRIAVKNHDAKLPKTLSELAASEESLLNHFRYILFICGTLFAIAIYGYVAKTIHHHVLLAAAWSITYVGELALALIPAKDKHLKVHTMLARIMGFGMLSMAYIYWLDLHAGIQIGEATLALLMSVLAILTILDRRRFLFYELPFIFFSHASIILAVIALH